MPDAVLAIDLGTSALKAVVFDVFLEQQASASSPIMMLRNKEIAEQYPEEWLSAVATAVPAAVVDARRQGYTIKAISFTGHMSAPVFVGNDRTSLVPVQTLADQRCAGEVLKLTSEQCNLVANITGNRPASYFALPKILWALSNHPQLLRKTEAILAPKDFLRLHLGGQFTSDVTDAYNTLLLDPEINSWSAELLKALALPRRLMPELRLPSQIDGRLSRDWAEKLGLDPGIPLVTGASDMATAALASGIDIKQRITVTVGTSATVLMACPKPIGELVGRVTFHPAVGQGLFALGSHFNGGAALDWFHRLLSGDNSQSQNPTKMRTDLQAIARAALQRAPLASDPVFLPYLLGSGSPRFNPDERGVFTGLSTTHDHLDMFRAVIEGITLDLCQTVADFQIHNRSIDHIFAGGGGMKLELWPQLLADISGLAVKTSKSEQTSARGAAILALKALGSDIPNSLVSTGDGDRDSDGEKLSVFYPDPDRQKIYQIKTQRFRDRAQRLPPVTGEQSKSRHQQG